MSTLLAAVAMLAALCAGVDFGRTDWVGGLLWCTVMASATWCISLLQKEVPDDDDGQ